MAVTYADLVAFGFSYVENNVSSNNRGQKFQINHRTSPLLRPGDACPCSEEDFVLLAEFSEIKGPVALVTIPPHTQHQGTIDINSFIMRIMSVDYQANPWGHFCMCEDTQVLQTHISHDRHAYVHYFTLYDLHARGFVRPMCIAYVSADHRKLQRLFPRMRKCFLEITEVMKVENRKLFSAEISSALHIIESFRDFQHQVPMFTLSNKSLSHSYQRILIILSPQQGDESCSNPSASMSVKMGSFHSEQLLHQCSDFRNMLQVVKASLNDSDFVEAILDHWQKALTMEDDISVSRGSELYLKLLSSSTFPNSASYKLNDGSCILDKLLRPMPALCPWGTACGLWRLLCAVQTFSHCELNTSIGSFPTLSFSQCGMYMTERRESDSAWEALSQPEYLQLIEALARGASEAAIFTKEEDFDISAPKEGASGNEGSSSYHSFSDSTSEPCTTVKSHNKNSNTYNFCNGSIGMCSDIQQEKNAKEILWHESHNSFNNDSASLTEPFANEVYHSVKESGSIPILANEGQVNEISLEITKASNIESDFQQASNENNDSNSNDSESFHDILEILHEDDTWSSGSSDDEPNLNVSWNQCLWTQYRPVSQPGHRLLKFFWTFRSAAQHVIYSLLMGRTLVLAGDARSERRVSRIINAVSPLVPPLDRNGLRVLRWHQGILVSAHIASYQVIGMCVPERLSIHDMISPRDKNSVSILDVNSEQLLGPAYHGHLLAAIGSNVRDFPSDHSVLLFVQSVLSGIAHKLQAYKALVGACSLELPSHVCRQLDLQGCDADMIRYLSKLPF